MLRRHRVRKAAGDRQRSADREHYLDWMDPTTYVVRSWGWEEQCRLFSSLKKSLRGLWYVSRRS
jgi:hypothetical protein